ncbi:hypothetical protein COS81_02020 [candidate division WWE3 bacterium CG06_land_8_20_14_3_00_42_16]|uniref:EamA domain-containing protein n=5 Tax=Katanobacteria TaxID=422282 RepID=A0A2M7ANI2_UNCKA|nr:MAG: hypothetical protein COS81_02020 [candidate division WWE3 bacterium CG06_land_8_20_14_3_00_42_16]PJA37659.1 MAG: hypothetical protein CO181_02590 [candidate division WWE3 bacterium CG_4_9_14_3_um_filter_43_9]PJC69003.1 MAG: hypothetical protein CO015_01985 [candidate division WWE3 bacterium CG_4_8_14_3_um_filter_42_11]
MEILTGLLCMFGWGASDFFAAVSSRKIGNILTLFGMEVVGLLVAFGYLLLSHATFDLVLLLKSLPLLIIITLLQIISFLAFYQGLTKAQVSLVSPLSSSWALVTTILSLIFLKETLTASEAIAITFIVISIFLLSINLGQLIKTKKMSVFAGVKEGIVAMGGFGISMFLIVLVSRTLGWFLPVFFFRLLAVFFLLLYLVFKKNQSFKKQTLSNLFLVIPIGLFDVGAFIAYGIGVRGERASIVAAVAGAFPLVTIILAKIFFKEKIVVNQAIGIIGIIGGLVILAL